MSGQTAVVTGATGQDGYFLTKRLLDQGWTVYAAVRDTTAAERLFGGHDRLRAVRRDLADPGPLASLIGDLRPDEMYNLAGESSVAGSFADPRATWETNAYVVVHLLDAIRRDSPGTRFYQASSGEMFGCLAGGEVIHDETSPLNPQSPYAAAKAAAHLLCRSYRESYGIRIACGILFNHESRRRGPPFLSRKVIDHVEALRHGAGEPLRVGNLKARRDWGFAPDYAEGMITVLRQASIRHVRDVSSEYRDYVLGTGHLYCVWELIDRAFFLAGFELDWDLDGEDPKRWRANFRDSGSMAVVVDPEFVRPADPAAIGANPSRARCELGWEPRTGLDSFLTDMLGGDAATSSNT